MLFLDQAAYEVIGCNPYAEIRGSAWALITFWPMDNMVSLSYSFLWAEYKLTER